MRLQGCYDAVQDRILLRLWDALPSGDKALWLTRRQWLAIALACYRTRSAAAGQGGQPVRPRKNAAGKAQEIGPGEGAESGSMESRRMQERGGFGEGGKETVKASLVSAVKFQRIPSGLRIKMTTKAPAPLVLTLKGESFPLFIKLVERLAARAKWDLPLAISRMSNAVPVKKRMLH